jgi:hypothetical protein
MNGRSAVRTEVLAQSFVLFLSAGCIESATAGGEGGTEFDPASLQQWFSLPRPVESTDLDLVRAPQAVDDRSGLTLPPGTVLAERNLTLTYDAMESFSAPVTVGPRFNLSRWNIMSGDNRLWFFGRAGLLGLRASLNDCAGREESGCNTVNMRYTGVPKPPPGALLHFGFLYTF